MWNDLEQTTVVPSRHYEGLSKERSLDTVDGDDSLFVPGSTYVSRYRSIPPRGGFFSVRFLFLLLYSTILNYLSCELVLSLSNSNKCSFV